MRRTLISMAVAVTWAATGAAAVHAADACPNAAMRAGPSAELPDCRAYELVSPGSAKRGGELLPYFAPIAKDGDRVAYTAKNVFGDATNAGANLGNALAYVAARSAGGWASTFTARFPTPDPTTQNSFLSRFRGASSDLSRLYYDVTYADGGLPSGAWTTTSAGSPSILARRLATSGQNPTVVATSSDGAVSVVQADEQPLVPLNGGGTPTGPLLYESGPQGLRLVDVDDDGTILNDSGALPAAGGGPYGPLLSAHTSVSSDGRRVTFLSQEPGAVSGDPQQLFVRVDGTHTVEVSASQSGSSGPPPAVAFAGASANATRIYFVSSSQLTADAAGAGPFLYQYHLPESALSGTLRLVAGRDHPVETTIVDQGNQYDVAQVIPAEDGSRVYFKTSDDGGAIYSYETATGATTLVAAAVGDARLVTIEGATAAEEFADVTPDGQHIVFMSKSALTPNDTNTGRKVYVYSARTRELDLVSRSDAGAAQPFDSGFVNTGGSGAGAGAVTFGDALPPQQTFVSDDGAYVFFQTEAALVPRDTNARQDVYRWSKEGVAIVTDGGGLDASYLLGASADGADVFFITLNRLAERDGDGAFDVYDARVGGGFRPSPPPSTCDADACQGPLTTAPGTVTLGSLALTGFGAARVPSRVAARSELELATTATIAGASGHLTVKVPSAGRLRTSGSGLLRSYASATKAGTYRIAVRLSARARQALGRKHRLRVRGTVRFTPHSGRTQSRRIQVTFKTPSTKKGR